MACRLVNLHSHPLRIDLRGGDVLVLAPHAYSRPLREELLYDNYYLTDWERAGWLRRLPAQMSDVLEYEAAAGRPVPAPRPAAAGDDVKAKVKTRVVGTAKRPAGRKRSK